MGRMLMLVAVLLWGCGDPVLDQADAFATRMCRCTDSYCARKVEKEFEGWIQKASGTEEASTLRLKLARPIERASRCLQAISRDDTPK
jgi:hypothetical protein